MSFSRCYDDGVLSPHVSKSSSRTQTRPDIDLKRLRCCRQDADRIFNGFFFFFEVNRDYSPIKTLDFLHRGNNNIRAFSPFPACVLFLCDDNPAPATFLSAFSFARAPLMTPSSNGRAEPRRAAESARPRLSASRHCGRG